MQRLAKNIQIYEKTTKTRGNGQKWKGIENGRRSAGKKENV